MSSPARRHQLRVLAELAALAAPHSGQVEGSAYELMLAQLYEHRRTLKGIQSVERKIEAKRSMVADFDAWIDGTPMARMGEPDEIAGAAVFLASKAGAYMTGQTIVIDGGATIT